MALELVNLDDAGVREAMLAEVDRDEAAGVLYSSDRLSPTGEAAYPDRLREAIRNGDDASLQQDFEAPGMLNSQETYMREGKLVTAKVSMRAAQTMAESEFNRFYMRGLCLSVKAEGSDHVEVCRARQSSRARPESQRLIGTRLDAEALLADLRAHIGEPPTLLPDVNSGLSVRKVEAP